MTPTTPTTPTAPATPAQDPTPGPAPAAPTTAPAVPSAPAPAVPPTTQQTDRALWAVVLLLCAGCVAYVTREHPTLTDPVMDAATVIAAVIGVVQWLRRS
ncbi:MULTISPECIES: hypothetical protein [unclassified Streptomyces]|uniref:hypothetical protein n=1 Tax=unclassified Streptomyces TaxID=2593676 RepID=UPI00225313D9|nr:MULTISPECIES: hypothetical protein [unclassified Streptomyces]MCX4871073.1 hypothetical protein [Streptomyces sp. NBC_00906]MCX4902699.1 hypothetical protein [Streptomyces sp. NBC_00892]